MFLPQTFQTFILVCILYGLVGSTAGLPPALPFADDADAGLTYHVFVPSLDEWSSTFENPRHYGCIHIWLRCIDTQLRGLFFVESLHTGATHTSASQWVGFKNFKLLLDGVPSKFDAANVGDFISDINETQINFGFIKVEIQGWRHYASFLLNTCTSGPPFLTRTQRIMSLLAYDEDLRSNRDVSVFVSGVEHHLRFHRCLINITSYEIVVQEEHLPIYMSNTYIAGAARSGFLSFKLKGSRPLMIEGSKLYFQGVYENIAVLQHWKENVLLFFWDPDEFLIVSDENIGSLNDVLNERSAGLSFERRGAACSTCPLSIPEAVYGIRNHSFLIERKHIPVPKVAIHASIAKCIAVHWVTCGAETRHVKPELAYIAHLTNWVKFRNGYKPKDHTNYTMHTFSSRCTI